MLHAQTHGCDMEFGETPSVVRFRRTQEGRLLVSLASHYKGAGRDKTPVLRSAKMTEGRDGQGQRINESDRTVV